MGAAATRLDSMSAGPTFRSRIVGALRRRDFDGDFAEVSTAPDGFTLKGADRGFLHVPFERVVRMRVGFTETKSGLVYEAKVWLDGERVPLAFFPYDRTDARGYSGAMRALAASLAESGKLDRVQRGVSSVEALLGPALIAPVVLFALFAASISADPLVWWHFVVIPLVPSVVLGILIWRAVTRHMPRAVTSLAELDVQLP